MEASSVIGTPYVDLQEGNSTQKTGPNAKCCLCRNWLYQSDFIVIWYSATSSGLSVATTDSISKIT
jgi:hypothetical protein